MVQIKNVLFGKLAVSTRFITEEQLQECLDYQKEIEERGERPPRLGEILEQKGYLTKQQIQSILETMSSMQRRRFGEIAVAFHFITLEQLETCLDIQKLLQAPQETVPLFGQALVTYRGFLKQVLAGGAHPKIGDVLVAMGYMRNHQVEAVLEEQNKRIVRCKSCEASLNISRFEIGQKIKCGQCNAVLDIVKPEGSEELDVSLPTETVSAPPPGGDGPVGEDQPLDPATAMMELDKEIQRVRATQQFSPAKVAKTPGRIADFQVVTRLGQDATGVIFKATQISKNRPVALKIMNPSVMNDATFQKKFIDEAKKVAALEHPNIKRVYSLGKSDNRFYIAMEFVEAESVYNVLEKQGKFHFETAIGIALSIAEALQYAQQQGLIHGDVRPSNVLLLRDGTVKVANLGLATKVSENILAISRSGQMAPFYIAPECVTGDREMDQRTDIYSLGATMFHMIAGRPPFQGQSPFEVLVRLTEETIPPLKFFDPSIPDSVCRVVEKMLEAEPQDRYQTWEEIITELHAIQAATGSAPAAEGAGAPSAAGGLALAPAKPAVKTAEDAKKAYEARMARSAQLRSLRRAAVVLLVVALIGGGIFVGKNHFAASDRADAYATLQSHFRSVPVSKPDFDMREEAYHRFINDYSPSDEANSAAEQLKTWAILKEVKKAQELQDIQTQVKSYVEKKQFSAAKKYLNHGSFWKPEDPQVSDLNPGIEQAADADWAELTTKVLEVAKSGQVQKAIQILEEACVLREWAKDLDAKSKLLGQIDQIKRDLAAVVANAEAEERKKKSRELMDKELKEVSDQMKRYQYQQAIPKLAALLGAVHPDHLAEVQEWRTRLQWLADLQQGAINAVNQEIDKWNRTRDPASDKRPTTKLLNGLEGKTLSLNANAITFQDAKGGQPEVVPWADLAPDTLITILGMGLQSGGSTNEGHFAFGDCASFKVETVNDVPTRCRLMTVAEREYKAAFDSGLAKQAGPRQQVVAQFFTDTKNDFMNVARAAIAAKKYPEARASLRTLLNLLPTRIDDIMKDIHGLMASSFTAAGGQYLDFTSAVPASLKPTAGWSVGRGVLNGAGKEESLSIEGKVVEVGMVFRMSDRNFILTLETGAIRLAFKPNENSGEGSLAGCTYEAEKPSKPYKCYTKTLSLNQWHILQIREAQLNGVPAAEVLVDGEVVTDKKGVILQDPFAALTIKLGGLSTNKEGKIDLLGLFTR